MTPLAQSLASSPELFPYALDPRIGTVSLIRLTEAGYRAASFLDGRVITPHTMSRTVPEAQIIEAVAEAALPEACDFIFHMGHVGSTLVSRLLGTHPQILSLREPVILRMLAEGCRVWPADVTETRIATFLKLWSRTFAKEQRVLVKATSFASEIAADVMARASAPRGIFMFVSPQSYLASIFGGPNSREETKILAPSRLARLHRRMGRENWQLASLTEGEIIAMSWACEMSALLAAKSGERVLFLDFDKFLGGPQPVLLAAFKHLGIDANESDVDSILSGPDMNRYSKAPEHAYDSELRNKVQDQARAAHAGEIARGLKWLERAADTSPLLREALNYSPI